MNLKKINIQPFGYSGVCKNGLVIDTRTQKKLKAPKKPPFIYLFITNTH